jgi:hypothetical protein
MYYDIRFNYGASSFYMFTEDINNYYEIDNTVPSQESCDCGGTVMTPENDFSGAQEGYHLSW